MKDFGELILALDATTKTNDKLDSMVSFLNSATDADKLWFVALLSGKRPKRPVKTSFLREWAAEVSGIPLWLLEESYHVVGDLAETVALILPDVTETSEKTLDDRMQDLLALKSLEEEEVKAYIVSAWAEMNKTERFVFNKLITGGFRIGVSQKLIVRALARHLSEEENLIAHRLMGNWDPQNVTFQKLLVEPDENENLSRPYPFYLAYPLEDTPQSLGDIHDWQLEYKWDGIRGQLILRNGEIFVWSRGEELVTERFPELEKLKDFLPNDCVIDGEIMAFKDGAPLTFNHLQTRIGRKKVSKKILEESPVVMIAYDLLELEGQDLREEAMDYRRAELEKIVASAKADSLMISEKIEPLNWGEAAKLREKSREVLSEGLMLKRRNSTYKVGRKRGDWWKWKVDPMSIDAVMIYAMRGHGRRANLYSDYTFAVWKGDELVPFAKAYSGLTDKEMQSVDQFVKKNTVERFGPVRSVKPELVFEIGFEGIAPSTRHKSGIALRFPRILRRRLDKRPEEANTLDDLKSILDFYNI
ncbi:MAG TPA: ATP-dependent DNA ligase [Cryomorphaceae bacterium]|nr:ATP-dependent DNA ligase [Cryomorphaceae bacterium]HKL39583.1 ATP-dependent DNA ligase [Cryomorphaceae bacterium]